MPLRSNDFGILYRMQSPPTKSNDLDGSCCWCGGHLRTCFASGWKAILHHAQHFSPPSSAKLFAHDDYILIFSLPYHFHMRFSSIEKEKLHEVEKCNDHNSNLKNVDNLLLLIRCFPLMWQHMNPLFATLEDLPMWECLEFRVLMTKEYFCFTMLLSLIIDCLMRKNVNSCNPF